MRGRAASPPSHRRPRAKTARTIRPELGLLRYGPELQRDDAVWLRDVLVEAACLNPLCRAANLPISVFGGEIGVERPVGENLCTEFHGSLTDFGREIPERCLQGTTRRVRSNRILAGIEIMRWDFGVRGMQHVSRCRIRSNPLVKAHRSTRCKRLSACTHLPQESNMRKMAARRMGHDRQKVSTRSPVYPSKADVRTDITFQR